MSFSHIVVPLDGSRLAAEAISHALALAQEHRAALVLLQVVDPAAPDLLNDAGWKPGLMPSEAQRKELAVRRSQAEGYLESIARSLALAEVDVTVIVIVGEPVEAILAVAATLERPALVMTPFGRTASRDASSELLGRVTRSVLQHSRLPVFIARGSRQSPSEAPPWSAPIP